jgi:hypothetical protein
MYEATLIEVPPRVELDEYREWKVPILDQGQEGACTGFGLATVANYLLRRRRVDASTLTVSPRMLYEMARRYDEWEGEDYSGSSARGAMKGWHKHGVCGDRLWPYKTSDPGGDLTEKRSSDAGRRPLGAYYRVNHKDLVAMHSAIAEVGILYATAAVHEGWNEVGSDGIIPLREKIVGGHAFAIVAYNDHGFWLQNSWGKSWGREGFAFISYDDWLENGTDIWVARLGVPLFLTTAAATAITHSAAAQQSQSYSFRELRPHIISIGNDGMLRPAGTFGTTEATITEIIETDFPRITKNWKKKRLLLYAHGGLVSESGAIQRVADYRSALLEHEVYPLAFIWKTDFATTISNILKDAQSRRRPEGFWDATKDFMLDRADDALEPLARLLSGKALWDEMKENARLATELNTSSRRGGARILADQLADLAKLLEEDLEIHIIGHSAGSIFHAPLVKYLLGKGLDIQTCTLWAPACTVDLFKNSYAKAILSKRIRDFSIFTLTDRSEQDDSCAKIYNKSLLYLVSNAFEASPRIPLFRDGVPILGMEKFIVQGRRDDALMKQVFAAPNVDWVLAPNTEPENSARRSTCTSHGGFDDDKATVEATLARMLRVAAVKTEVVVSATAGALQTRRREILQAT